MRAVLFDRFGPAEVLGLRDVATPVPGPDEVLVKLEWAAVNHLDLDVREGISGMAVSLPHIPGTEGTGRVSAVGATVRRWSVGQRVGTYAFRICRQCDNCRADRINMCLDIRTLGGQLPGAYAEYICVREDQLVAVPDLLSLHDAVAAYKLATAWEALKATVQVQPGEVVLVTGAGGGVGSAAVVLALHLGARVVAASGSDEKNARLRALGAAEVLNYRSGALSAAVKRLTAGRGVDVVFDVAAGPGLGDAIAATRPGGRVAVIGAHAGERVEIDMLDLFRRHISIHGCGRYTPAILGAVFEARCAGLPAPPIHQEFALQDAAAAHRLMQQRDFFGRLLLRCGAGD